MSQLKHIEILETLQKEKGFLKDNFKVKDTCLFGSYARNEQMKTSDIDILVDFYEPIGWNVVELKDFLEKKLHHKVDLVLKEGISRNTRLWQSLKDDNPGLFNNK